MRADDLLGKFRKLDEAVENNIYNLLRDPAAPKWLKKVLIDATQQQDHLDTAKWLRKLADALDEPVADLQKDLTQVSNAPTGPAAPTAPATPPPNPQTAAPPVTPKAAPPVAPVSPSAHPQDAKSLAQQLKGRYDANLHDPSAYANASGNAGSKFSDIAGGGPANTNMSFDDDDTQSPPPAPKPQAPAAAAPTKPAVAPQQQQPKQPNAKQQLLDASNNPRLPQFIRQAITMDKEGLSSQNVSTWFKWLASIADDPEMDHKKFAGILANRDVPKWVKTVAQKADSDGQTTTEQAYSYLRKLEDLYAAVAKQEAAEKRQNRPAKSALPQPPASEPRRSFLDKQIGNRP